MELASRIVSIVLGVAVMVLLLWPVTVPVGFGEVWWASRQAQSRHEDSARAAAPAGIGAARKPCLRPKLAAPPPATTPARHAVAPSAEDATKPATVAQATQQAPEQLAALNDKDKTGAVAPKQTTKRYYRVTVRDGGTLQAGKVVIRLSGIAARDADATCKDGTRQELAVRRCGQSGAHAADPGPAPSPASCRRAASIISSTQAATVAGTDLSTWLVRQGWATPKDANEPALAEAAAAAKSEKLGLWHSAE